MSSTKTPPVQQRSFGKIILIGEHAVVHGHKALAGAIDRGLRCRASAIEGTTRLLVPEWHIDVLVGDTHPVAKALSAIVEASEEQRGLLLEVESDLPAAAGLGSSAALCVSIARALRPELPGKELQELANCGERCFHERPSGIDVALACEGGFGVYQRATGLIPIKSPSLSLVVGLSGLPRSTAAMVSGVAQRMAAERKVRDSIEHIGRLSESAESALRRLDYDTLGGLMNQCHEQLQTIGVSVETLDRMVLTARDAGAVGAKLTGAGGGGSMIALAPQREEAVKKALEDLGHQSFITTLGACA